MNDIEKKMEALKAEFFGKLEELKKEAEMQKKQEEWKFGEKYFYISQSGRVIWEIFFEQGNVPNKSQIKCGCCYDWSSCMICSVRIMCRIGKMTD